MKPRVFTHKVLLALPTNPPKGLPLKNWGQMSGSECIWFCIEESMPNAASDSQVKMNTVMPTK